ncbi:MAG: thioesterase [Desulfobacterales bacterium]|nr:MAG: thioesterase [Desulfobacterales bacterium]
MARDKHYFRTTEQDPPPLVVRSKRRVRFEEVDLIGMVWHGRYPGFFEDGRIAFGDRYGMTYQLFIEKKTVAPVVEMHIDYRLPLRFDEMIEVEAALYWNEAARLDFAYKIFNGQGQLAASGYTVQLFTDPDGRMLLFPPDWLVGFRDSWKRGEL